MQFLFSIIFMKKIGVSIPWDYLSGKFIIKESKVIKDTYGRADKFLKLLQNLEVTHVELRHRKAEMSEMDMEAVFKLLYDFKFKITIHGDTPLQGNNWSINDVFPWLHSYKNIYSNFTEPIIVTLHPFTGSKEISYYREQTVTFIKRLDDFITKDNLPVKLALENQRSKKTNDPGKSFIEIEEMWKDINKTNVGICWDMGHCFANYLIDNSIYPLFPHKKFTKAAIHTHIHDLGPDGRTHWIFKENRVPLADNVSQLKDAGYSGIYNLELSFDRFFSEPDQPKLLKETIIKLREMI
jgi:sugar phosphate isomerase/epimerase